MDTDISDRETTLALQIESVCDKWLVRLEQAVINVENNRRQELKLDPIHKPTVFYQHHTPKQKLAWLNWKVWCQRYCVTLEFVYTAVTNSYAYLRTAPHHNVFTIGLPVFVCTGPRARSYVEEAVLKEYPQGENYRAVTQENQQLYNPKLLPVGELEYDTDEEMINTYQQAVLLRRDVTQRKVYRRPWRGNPWL